MIRIYLEGIGLRGPGLDGWAASAPILAGSHYAPAPTKIPAADLLPPNERRRAVQTVRIALAAGAEAFAAAARDPAATPTIFTSSGGDGDTIHDILTVLASPTREISPTKFHNSVHNAPAGYWSIATGARAASSSLCAHDGSFSAGLLEAAIQAITEDCAVALIAYDTCYPGPLNETRPIGAAFAVAFVMAPEPTPKTFAALALSLQPSAEIASMPAATLESLRQNTPAARGLPLLAMLAAARTGETTLDYLDDLAMHLQITHPPAYAA